VSDSSFYKGLPVLVIGGMGFIGSNLAIALVEAGADVLLVDNMNQNYGANFFNIDPIRERVQVNVSDIRDRNSLPYLLKDRRVIFNLAAQTSHMDSMRDPMADLEINCVAQLGILEECRRSNPDAMIVFASTRQIYGRPLYLPVDEKHPLQPVDVNGINKISGESYHRLYNSVHGIRSVILRLTNTFGPRMRIKDERQTFLGVWVRNALTGVPIEVWGGEQRRDYSYVDDVVDAFLIAGQRPDLAGEVFNIGSDDVLSLSKTAGVITSIHPKANYIHREFPAERKKIDIGDCFSSFAKFQTATGWSPKVPFVDGIKTTLAFYESNLGRYYP
jgi:nucleoside-diphosphate-sugar epimerase